MNDDFPWKVVRQDHMGTLKENCVTGGWLLHGPNGELRVQLISHYKGDPKAIRIEYSGGQATYINGRPA